MVFVTEEEGAFLATCAKHAPGRLTGDARVSPSLAADVMRFLSERFGDGTVDAASLELIYVAIDRYCARHTAIEAAPGRAAAYLVGDACFGVPYFRSLSNGFKCASTLAGYLAGAFGGPVVATAGPARAYRWYVLRLYTQASTRANAMHAGAAVLDGGVGLVQRLIHLSPEAQAEEEAALAKLGSVHETHSVHRNESIGEKVGGVVGNLTRGGVKLTSSAMHGFASLTGLKF